MPIGLIIELIVIPVIVLIIIISVNAQRKKNEKAEEERREAEKRRKQEMIEKFKKNATVQAWGEDISGLLLNIINNNPYKDYEFHLKSYRQNFAVGYNLRDIYSRLFKEYRDDKGAKILKVYNFAPSNLPELKGGDELTLFSIAMGQLVAANLEKENIKIRTKQILRELDNEGHSMEDRDDEITVLMYEHKQANTTW